MSIPNKVIFDIKCIVYNINQQEDQLYKEIEEINKAYNRIKNVWT